MELIPPTPSVHRLQLGLPGYLIPFAPLAFASQCQISARKPPSPLVFLPISTHFTATPGIPLSSLILNTDSFLKGPAVELQDLLQDTSIHLQALYAQ